MGQETSKSRVWQLLNMLTTVSDSVWEVYIEAKQYCRFHTFTSESWANQSRGWGWVINIGVKTGIDTWLRDIAAVWAGFQLLHHFGYRLQISCFTKNWREHSAINPRTRMLLAIRIPRLLFVDKALEKNRDAATLLRVCVRYRAYVSIAMLVQPSCVKTQTTPTEWVFLLVWGTQILQTTLECWQKPSSINIAVPALGYFVSIAMLVSDVVF